jgi:hypothetical protein
VLGGARERKRGVKTKNVIDVCIDLEERRGGGGGRERRGEGRARPRT